MSENHQGETMALLHGFERENFGEERKKLTRIAPSHLFKPL